MQIYTKILIGMLVGAVIGFTLGPKSPFLEKDLYKISDTKLVQFYTSPEAGSEGLVPFPDGTKIDFKVEETRFEKVQDKNGDTFELATWAKVGFRYNERLAIGDRDGRLADTIGNPKAGGQVTTWLRMKHIELNKGGFSVWPEPVSNTGDWVVAIMRPAGDIFLRLIKMVIVPLVFASLLVGVASLGDVRTLGRLGTRTLGLYVATTAVAVSIGVILANLIKPGSFVSDEAKASLQAQFQMDAGDSLSRAVEAPSAMDNILGIIPDNPIASLANGEMLQTIFFAIIFGIALTMLDDKNGRPIVTFFDRVQQAMVLIIHMVMAIAPYGVAALVADVIGQSGLSVLGALMVYSLTVLLGLGLQAFGVYGSIVRFMTDLSFPSFFRAARPSQLIAFSTSSSSAALPVTMECAESNLGISNSVSSFVLPLGSTVNMDGTALYQGVAAVFIAQVFGMDLTLGEQLGIVLTATLASIGAAGVPGAGMVTLAMVLTAAGIPAVGIALILGTDRLLDMFRTAVNVTGDLAVTAAMATAEGEKLHYITKAEDAADPDKGFEHRLEHEQRPVEPDEKE